MNDEPVVPGFSWDEGTKLVRLGQTKDGEDEFVPVLPFNVVPLRSLREGDTVKVIEADVVYVNGRRKRVQFPTEIIAASRPAQVLAQETGIDINHKEASHLAEFLEIIATEQSTVPDEEVLTTSEWRGDVLVAPGEYDVSPRKQFAELAKYGQTKGDEERARAQWRGVLQIAAHPGNEKFLLVLGMPLGSLYAARLRRPPYSMGTGTFALHLTGDSARGKTQAAVTAMMTMGDASEKATEANLYRTWDMSAQAPIALAHQLGVLPILLDEAATSQKTPEEFTTSLFALAQGTERQRATVKGDLDEVDRWECCLLSTGEMRLTSKSGLVGVRRRIQEIYAPFVAIKEHSDEAFRLASSSYGWPLRWITRDPQVDLAVSLLPQIEHGFDDAVTWLNAAAQNLSVCGLGTLMLARSLGMEEVGVMQVHKAVQSVVEKMGRAAVEEGLDAGIKLAKAVWDAVAMRPNAFPQEDMTPAYKDREGVRFKDGTVGVISRSAMMKIAMESGLPDYQAGIRLLQASMMMETEGNRDQIAKSYLDDRGEVQRKRMYVFKPLSERDQ